MRTQLQKQLDLLHEWHDLLINALKKEGYTLFQEKRNWQYFSKPAIPQSSIPVCIPPKPNTTQKHLNDCLKSYVCCNASFEFNAPIKALKRPIVWAMFSHQTAEFEDARVPFIFAANCDLVIVANYSNYFDPCDSLTANQYLAKKLVSDLIK